MPRANRYYAPGCVWHITHRCHDRAFLLKFGRDRSRWMHWLGVARKRYALAILDYCVTSNHVHLLVRDQGEGEITYLLGERDAIRELEWTESVAVGGEIFVERVKQALRDVRATWQVMADRHADGEVCLKEGVSPYNTVLGGKNAPPSIVFRSFNDASR